MVLMLRASLCLQHFLLSYRDALAEICKAQINRKKRLEVHHFCTIRKWKSARASS